ncbi:hypothetical protein R6Q59_020069 [Mikania micrantha]
MQEAGRINDVVVVNERSKKKLNGDVIKVFPKCDRGGEYKGKYSMKPSRTKRTNCSFQLVAKYFPDDSCWMLRVTCFEHQDDEYEDMDDMTFVDNENEIQMDNSDDDLGNEDNEKYDVPDAARKWVLMTIGHSYKVHKCRFNKQHFYQFKDDKTRWKNRPKSIPEGDFAQLLRLWNNTKVKKHCLRAKEIHMSQKNMHTAGPKSFARIRDEMKNDDPNKDFPTLTKMFEQTRKRTEGRVYVDTYDDTKRKIEQMKNYKASENESASMDPFRIVVRKENGGYCRLYGRGVTNTLIKKMNGGDTTYMVPGSLVESFNESFEGQKHQLLEMKKELDEEHEKKKFELEAIQEDIKNQQEHLEATMRKLMEQLPHED